MCIFTGLRGRFSVFAVQKHRYLRRSQKREVFTTPLSPVYVSRRKSTVGSTVMSTLSLRKSPQGCLSLLGLPVLRRRRVVAAPSFRRPTTEASIWMFLKTVYIRNEQNVTDLHHLF